MKKMLIIWGMLLNLNAQTIHQNIDQNVAPIQQEKPANTPTLSQTIINAMQKPTLQENFLESDYLDLNYITNMIPHHQGAIDASQILLKYSKNPTIRKIAQRIIKDQKAEIEEFSTLLPTLETQKKLYSPKEVTLFNQQAKADKNTMIQEMDNLSLTPNINKNFLAIMIFHHQYAIDISKEILKYTQNEQIRIIAQRIIQTQEQEVKEFETLLLKAHL